MARLTFAPTRAELSRSQTRLAPRSRLRLAPHAGTLVAARDPALVADRASRYAESLDRTAGAAATAALEIVRQDPQLLRRAYGIVAARAREASAAWEVAGDAYEDAGDGPNAGWAREQARHAARRAVEMTRVRFLIARTFDRYGPGEDETESGYEYEDTPVTLEEAMREIRETAPFDSVEESSDLLRLYGADARIEYRTGVATRSVLHIRGEPRALRRLADLIDRETRRRRL